MIKYREGPWGLALLKRIHGSSVYRAVIPAAISSGILLLLVRNHSLNNMGDVRTIHPYVYAVIAVGILLTFVFKANFAYGRYWDSSTSIFQMQSKWLDVGILVASFHLQSKHYTEQNVKPPSFGEHMMAKRIERTDRRSHEQLTYDEIEDNLPDIHEDGTIVKSIRGTLRGNMTRIKDEAHSLRKRTGRIVDSRDLNVFPGETEEDIERQYRVSTLPDDNNNTSQLRGFDAVQEQEQPQSSIRQEFVIEENENTWIKICGDDVPPLFLQEAAHLLSLLSAVAMSTLRCEIEAIPSPLVTYKRGEKFPELDPDKLPSKIRGEYLEKHYIWRIAYFLLGLSHSPRHRTLYNASRPFHVLGGVSNLEFEALQRARGPSAKVALVLHWLEEFLSREYLNDSMGDIHPAIFSRTVQFVSDGMLGYQQCRKVSFIQFPFPHQQLTVALQLIMVWMFPFLFYDYVRILPWACVLNFCCVMIYVGLHEVSRELESPFQNTPNDIPLNAYQAQFNEALISSLYSGYHPDSWWTPVDEEKEHYSNYFPPSSSTTVKEASLAKAENGMKLGVDLKHKTR